jgi:hypothetical protein
MKVLPEENASEEPWNKPTLIRNQTKQWSNIMYEIQWSDNLKHKAKQVDTT